MTPKATATRKRMGIDISADRKEKKRLNKVTVARQERSTKIKAGIEGFKKGYKGSSHVCTQCGRQAKPALITKGNIFMEIFLWLLFLLPGLIYSIWRHASRFRGCPDCKTQTMVKGDSPVGKKLLA